MGHYGTVEKGDEFFAHRLHSSVWTDADVATRTKALCEATHQIDKLNADLAPFEQIKRFALLERDLSQEAGELTPTLKVRRRVIAQQFEKLIESLYDAGA